MTAYLTHVAAFLAGFLTCAVMAVSRSEPTENDGETKARENYKIT